MADKKLFKKLNEQVEVVRLEKETLTEEEKASLEESVIFGDFIDATDDLVITRE